MRINEFTSNYSTEIQCRKAWKEMREKQGITCRSCSSNRLTWIALRQEWRCLSCKTTITLRSGTIMENSKLPFLIWFQAIYLMTNTKKGISALELQRQLGMKRYEPVWYMMHKIRIAMGNRDDKYTLEGVVEVDDAFVKVVKPNAGPKTGKKGRGSETSVPIIVMVSTEPTGKQQKHRPSVRAKYLKMLHIPDVTANSVEQSMEGSVDENSTIKTDGFRSYSKLKSTFKKHDAHVIPPTEAHKILPCVHTAIGNLKRWINGMHHHVNDKYLQNYLNEFTYKTNRRYFADVFSRCLIAGISLSWGACG